MNEVKWLIFDWDGTLMNSIARIVASMQAAAVDVNLPVPTDAQAKSIIGMSLPIAIENLFPGISHKNYQLLCDAYRQQYVEKNLTPSPLFDDTEFVLSQFKNAGFKLAVATGKARAGLDRVLGSSQLTHYFDDSICADESVSKPAPDMLVTLAKRNQIEMNQAILIGDSVHDLKMAQNANMRSIGVTMGANTADELKTYQPIAIIDQLTALLTLFKL